MEQQLGHLLGRALDALDAADRANNEARLALLAVGRRTSAADAGAIEMASALRRTERVVGLHSVRVPGHAA